MATIPASHAGRQALVLALVSACGSAPCPQLTVVQQPPPETAPAAAVAEDQVPVEPPVEQPAVDPGDLLAADAAARVAAVLERKLLPDHALLAQLIEIEGKLVELSFDYGARHPEMRTLTRKARRLYEEIDTSTVEGAPDQTRTLLKRAALKVDLALAELETGHGYGPNHPSVRKAKGLHTFYAALLSALDQR